MGTNGAMLGTNATRCTNLRAALALATYAADSLLDGWADRIIQPLPADEIPPKLLQNLHRFVGVNLFTIYCPVSVSVEREGHPPRHPPGTRARARAASPLHRSRSTA